MQLSDGDRDEIARTIIGEAGDQPAEGQAAVAHVILNRMQQPDQFSPTVMGVIHQRRAFEAWERYKPEDPRNPANYDPTTPEFQRAQQIAAATAAGLIPDPTSGATHYYSPRAQAALHRPPPSWAKGPPVASIGGHVFYLNPDRPVRSPGPPPDAEAMTDDEALKFLNSRRQQQAAPQPDQLSDDDALKYLEQRRAATPSAPAAPSAQASPAAVPAAARPSDWASSEHSGAIVEGMPIIGPAMRYLSAAAGAAIQPMVDPKAPATFGERFSKNLEMERQRAKEFAEKHPVESTLSGLLGGALATVPAAGTALGARALGMAGSTLGARLYGGTVGGATIGGLDALMRGENPVTGAAIGGGGGTAGVLGAEGVSKGVSGLLDMARRGSGPLAGLNSVGRGWLQQALANETPASLAAAQQRMGPQGFLADINPAMTELAAGIANKPQPPGSTIVGEAYRTRQAGQRAITDQAVTSAIGPKIDVEQFKNFITENRAAAADPLYAQWRSTQVQPTPELKALYPTLDRLGLLDAAQEHALMRDVPFDRNFFTAGPQKNYPTTESWDMIKRAIDSRINQAYNANDNTRAADLITLKNRLVSAIDNTPAGPIWRQARQEFAERSALLDQIRAGQDTFLGGRSGLSVDELRQELSGLSGPERAARIVGLRNAVDQVMGDTENGDGALRKKLLAPNNIEKLQLLIGDQRTEQLRQTLEQQQYLTAQAKYVDPRQGPSTTPRAQAVKNLEPPSPSGWNPNLTSPLSWIPPSWLEAVRPSTVLQGAREERYASAKQGLAGLLTRRGTDLPDVLRAIDDEVDRHASALHAAQTVRQVLTGAAAGPGAEEARKRNSLMALVAPAL